MKRRDVLKLAGGAAAALATPSLVRGATPPNIIVILADDMTYEQQAHLVMLNKRIAANGVRFEDHYVAVPLCEPSRMTMWSGEYAHNHGMGPAGVTWQNMDWTTCLARRLQLAGYRTGFYGKWMNSYMPADNGGAVPPGYDDWFSINPQTYYGYNYNFNGTVAQAGYNEAEYFTTACTSHLLDFVNATSQPFAAFFSPHCPHFEAAPTSLTTGLTSTPNQAYKGSVAPSRTSPRTPAYNKQIVNPPSYMNLPELGQGTIDRDDAFYRGQLEMLFELDRAIGQIFDRLTTLGRLANTWIIFTSDNGFMLGEHRDPDQKQVTYLPASRVPLIISGPGVTAGGHCPSVVSQVDIIATIYALTGATSTRTLDGVSLVPLLTNPTGPPVRTTALVELPAEDNVGGGSIRHPRFQAIFSTQWAYAEYPDDGSADLYDRIGDPYQLVNQIGNPAYAGAKADLAAQLAAMRTCAGSSCVI